MTTTLTTTPTVGQAVRIDVQVTPPPVGATFTVTRIMKGLRTAVRGADEAPLPASGQWVYDDREIAYHTDIAYSVEVVAADWTVIGATTAPPVQVLEDRIWLRTITRPALSMPVSLVGAESGERTTGSRAAVLRPIGRSRPVVLGDIRSSSEGTLTVLTETTADERRLRLILATGDVLLLTGPLHLEPVMWPMPMIALDVQVARVSPAAPQARMHTIDWVEVDPPPDLGVPKAMRWADYKALGMPWSTFRQAAWADRVFPPGSTAAAAFEEVWP